MERKVRPGGWVRLALALWAEPGREMYLVRLIEQTAIRRADLEMLREVRAYLARYPQGEPPRHSP